MSDQRLQAVLSIAGADAPLTVHAVRGSEEVSRAFRYEVDFSSDALGIDALAGARVSLVITAPRGGERRIFGAASELNLLVGSNSEEGAKLRYRAVVVPVPFLVLSMRRGSRIFQEKDVVEVVKGIWKSAGLEAKDLTTKGVTGKYVARDFCVQYDESDWSFVCRLLEDEGIFFAFGDEDDHGVMKLEDDSSAVDALDPDELPHAFFPDSDGDEARVFGVETAKRLCVSKVEVNDYDVMRPSASLSAKANGKDAIEREHYEHPAGFTKPNEGTRRAKVRLAELRAESHVLLGQTDALFAVPGRRFKMSGHPADDGGYFLTQVTLQARIEEETQSGPMVDTGHSGLDVRFRAIPEDQLFRPARVTPRPKWPGLQTALVCGPKGEEIHCDKHGRVKLQFPWDREANADDKVSTWVRVTQPHTTGSFLLPRVGWEVLVEMEDGNPDRPVCLGRVWNPTTPPPVQLPAGKTQTGHSSLSSPGGNGTNEVTFEDTAGGEKVRIQSVRNVMLNTANDKLFSVGKQATHKVAKKRQSEVKGNEDIGIGSDFDFRIGGTETVNVSGTRGVKVTGSANEEVKGALTRTVGGMENIKVGSAMAAALNLLKEVAIAKVQGMAANAAEQAQAALLGPIAPVLAQAKAALGSAAQFAGPAAALVAGGDPKIAAFAEAAGKLSNVPGAAEAGDIAAGIAARVLARDLAKVSDLVATKKTEEAAAEKEAGGAAAGAGPAGPTAGSGGGQGTWKTTVVGAVTENIGGLAAINSLGGVSFGMNATCKEMVGAARVEMIKNGKAETTGGDKLETVGVYMINAKESLAVTAKAIALNIAGAQKQKISGTHSIAAEALLVINSPKLKMKAGGTLTISVGKCKVVVSSGGIVVEGASKMVIDASQIELNESPLG